MMSPAQMLRRVFLLPTTTAGERQRLLRETKVRVDHADRVVANAVTRLNRSAARLHELTEGVVEHNVWPGDET